MKQIFILGILLFGLSHVSAQYCTPAHYYGCSDGDQIDSFSILSAGFNHASSGCSANAYGDFTSMTISLAPNVAYPFTITHGYSSQEVRIWADFNNDNLFNEVTELVGSASSGSTLTSSGSITIPAGTPLGTYRMRVGDRYSSAPIPCNVDGYGETHDYTLLVTTPPTCSIPTGVTAANITSSGATINWTAPATAPSMGYDVYYSTVNTAPTSTTAPNFTAVTGTSQALSGLAAQTTYYVWVRSRCSATDQSFWMPLPNFMTACVATNVPYTQNFESATPPAMPTCTLATNMGAGNNWQVYNNPGNGFTTNTLRYAFDYNDAANAWFFTQGVNLTAGTVYRLKYIYGNNGTYTEKMKVTVGSAQTAASQTTILHDYTAITGVTYPVTDFYTFTPTTTGVYYFAFNAYSDADQFNLYVDDIVVELNPSCVEPTAVTSSAVTPQSATFSWTPPITAPASGYEYYYSTSNTVPTASTVPSGTVATTTVTLSGLTPSTNYYFWVRSKCSATDTSSWTFVSIITTATFCPDVTSPADGTSNLTLNPTITWSPVPGATGYKLTVGTTPNGTNIMNNVDLGNVTTYTFTTALANNTLYYFTVNAYNSTITSNSCEEFSFTTICTTATSFSENFDNITDGDWPPCWSKLSATGSAYTQASGAMSSPNNLYIYGYNEFSVVSMPPVSTLQTGNYALAFDGRANYTPGGIIQIGYLTDPVNSSTFVPLGAYTASSITTVDHFVLPITGVPAGITTLAFRHTGNPDNSVLIDNVQYDLLSALGTSEVIADVNKLNVYPNPFTDILHISDIKDVASITVTDMSGRTVRTIAKPTAQLQLGDLNAGLYLVTLKYKDGTAKTVKAIKK